MRLLRIAALGVVIASVVGCGGGGASGSQTGTGSGEVTAGSARVKFSGNAKPLTSTSNSGVTVEGLAGASFSYIDLYPQPSLLNTMLVYQLGYAEYTYSFLTGQSKEITHHNIGQTFGSNVLKWGQGGLLVGPADYPAIGLIQMYADGTDITPLPTNGVVSSQAISWDGSKIAGLDKSGNFVVMSSTGSNVVQLQPASNLDGYFQCTWSGNSTLIFIASGRTVRSIPATGGTPSNNYDIFGNPISVSGYSDGSDSIIETYGSELASLTWYSNNNIASNTFTPTGLSDYGPTIAPDNQTMAFYRRKSAANDGYSGIWVSTVNGNNPYQLVADPTGSNQILGTISNINWSPYPSHRRFVGSGGIVATASSGFLLSQMGAGISGFFTFTAKTPSTATITPSATGGSYSPLVFSIHADSISQVWWKNGYYLPSSTAALSGETDTVVSFDGSNGQVTFVAPALATRGVAAKPSVTVSGATTTCLGPFSAVYDGSGKNLAPSGAKSILVDSKTGKLTGIR